MGKASFFLLFNLFLTLVELKRYAVGLGGAGVLEGKGLSGLYGDIVQDVQRLDVIFDGNEMTRLLGLEELNAQ